MTRSHYVFHSNTRAEEAREEDVQGRYVVSCQQLGVARIIYQLATRHCDEQQDSCIRGQVHQRAGGDESQLGWTKCEGRHEDDEVVVEARALRERCVNAL